MDIIIRVGHKIQTAQRTKNVTLAPNMLVAMDMDDEKPFTVVGHVQQRPKQGVHAVSLGGGHADWSDFIATWFFD